jgi:SAM-dependent methyltransferase
MNNGVSGATGKPDINLTDAYSVITPEDNKALYARWAASYEQNFVAAKKYRYPKAIAELFNQVVPIDIGLLVVDVGCGTGLAGTYLASQRHQIMIDGIDISPEMLEQARAKNREDEQPVYRHLIEADLTQTITNAFGPYDALISSGTFTHGHLGPAALRNLLPLVRMNGWFLIGINAEHFTTKGFKKAFRELAHEGAISDPIFQKINVYEEASPHYGDQSVTARFMSIS